MNRGRQLQSHAAGGWTLPELLLVVGIIVVLFSILLPGIGSARRYAAQAKCQSNLRSIGEALFAYAGENKGWLYPIHFDQTTGATIPHLGTNSPPHLRWPAVVFKVPAAHGPLPYDPNAYTVQPYDPDAFPAAPFTPAVMVCPLDQDPAEAHTYVLNGHLAARGFRLSSKDLGGRTPDAVILSGEKPTPQRDYFMDAKEFERMVDPYRHGRTKGSNYLFIDGHAATQMPRDVKAGIDPWDVAASR